MVNTGSKRMAVLLVLRLLASRIELHFKLRPNIRKYNETQQLSPDVVEIIISSSPLAETTVSS